MEGVIYSGQYIDGSPSALTQAHQFRDHVLERNVFFNFINICRYLKRHGYQIKVIVVANVWSHLYLENTGGERNVLLVEPIPLIGAELLDAGVADIARNPDPMNTNSFRFNEVYERNRQVIDYLVAYGIALTNIVVELAMS